MRRKVQKRKYDPSIVVKTFRFRVKDSSTDGRVLRRMARAVNRVWNHCNGAQLHALKHNTKWPYEKALQDSTRGASRELGISSQTVQAICGEYVTRRTQFNKAKLRWRGKRSLGWVPFKNQTFSIDQRGNSATYSGHTFRLWKHRDLPPASAVKSGSFSEDARGRWYCNVVVEYVRTEVAGDDAAGIDLGLKDAATLSTGDKIVNARNFAANEIALAKAQRANKSRLVKTIHAKIANSRKDHLHKATTEIANRFGFIAVGNVSGKWLQALNGKSSADAATGTIRNLLRQKAIARGAVFVDVSEYLTTQVCSECDSIGGPKGAKDLKVREWKCGHCGVIHDRDVNAARNILRAGLRTLEEGAPLEAEGDIIRKNDRSLGLQAGE